jgi:1L-myo-inositol 1-phosphate cytidylyltransferase
MKCLIVAAGTGSRLRDKGESKPLIELAGSPLIERVIKNASKGGVTEFIVVSGYRGEELRAFLDGLAQRENLKITHAINNEWERPNGLSVYAAHEVIEGDFLLSMCDHLVQPEIIHDIINHQIEKDTVTLCVDYNIKNLMIDMEDVTRLKCTADKIQHIGKMIEDYNAFDTGIFKCTQAMFKALRASAEAGDESISGAMNMLGSWGQARTFDIQGKLWLDVDDSAAFEKAQKLIADGKF